MKTSIKWYKEDWCDKNEGILSVTFDELTLEFYNADSLEASVAHRLLKAQVEAGIITVEFEDKTTEDWWKRKL